MKTIKQLILCHNCSACWEFFRALAVLKQAYVTFRSSQLLLNAAPQLPFICIQSFLVKSSTKWCICTDKVPKQYSCACVDGWDVPVYPYDGAILVLIKHANTLMCVVCVHIPVTTTTFTCNTQACRQSPSEVPSLLQSYACWQPATATQASWVATLSYSDTGHQHQNSK